MKMEDLPFLLVYIILPHLIPFVAVFLYAIKIERYKNLWLSFLPLGLIVPVTIYGYLRKIGKIIYATDEPTGILWSTWYFNGTWIFMIGYSAFFGFVGYFIYKFIKNIANKTK